MHKHLRKLRVHAMGTDTDQPIYDNESRRVGTMMRNGVAISRRTDRPFILNILAGVLSNGEAKTVEQRRSLVGCMNAIRTIQ